MLRLKNFLKLWKDFFQVKDEMRKAKKRKHFAGDEPEPERWIIKTKMCN